MLIVKLIRFLKGYVMFVAQGAFVERFLNLIARAGIPLWNGSKKDITYTGYTTAKAYKSMRSAAKKTGVHIKVKEKYGLPFILHKYKKRKGIFIGVLIFIVFLYSMGNFIWTININGNQTISEDIIREKLSELGVKKGVLKSSVDADTVENMMRRCVDGIAWIAVNIEGSTVNVEINEAIKPPEKIDTNTPCNIIASESGQIKYMEIYGGQTLVAIGDTVLKGDIIVSGIVEGKKTGNMSVVHSWGKVVAEVEQSKTIDVPFKRVVNIPTGEVINQNSLDIVGFNIPLYLPEKIQGEYILKTKNNAPKIFGINMPFNFKNQEYIIQIPQTIILSEDEAKEAALQKLYEWEKENLSQVKIVSKNLRGVASETLFTIACDYVLEKNIAKQVLF